MMIFDSAGPFGKTLLTNIAATLYTVPTGKQLLLNLILIFEAGTADDYYTLWVNGNGSDRIIKQQTTILTNKRELIRTRMLLAPASTIQGKNIDNAGAVYVTLFGQLLRI